jgi:hypothetical protein
MQRERQNMQNKPCEEKKEGYIIVPNYFLKEWVSILGVGPVVLYQELLTYCHKEKYIAWPTINSLCQQMGIAKTTLLRYQNTLARFGLVKNISRGNSTTGHYKNNVYQITPFENLPDHRDIRYQNDTYNGSKMKPDGYQNDTCIGSETIPVMVSKRYPNNTNLNITKSTTTNGAVVAVNFKKLKEKGEEKMRVIRERMVELDFKKEFIEKTLKEYSTKKIDAKLDLLMEKKNIQNPAGWLKSALKNDYQGEEQPSYPIPQREEEFKEALEADSQLSRMDSRFRGNDIKGNENNISRGVLPYAPHPNVIANDRRERDNPVNTPEWTSREKALEAIKLIQDNLSACISPHSSRKRAGARKNLRVR